MVLPKVYIIILNWNGTADSIECIRSLKDLHYDNYEILLIDNNSDIESFKRIISVFPKIKYVRNEKNLGFAEGNNVGIRLALKNKPNYILLLNNDTIVERNFLMPLIKYMEEYRDIGICGPVVCHYDIQETIWQTGGIYSRITGRLRMKYADMPINSIKEKTIELDYIPGACLLIRAELIKDIGLLDKKFFNQCEDLDWGLKTKLIGKRVMCISNSVIYHKVSNSTPLSINNYFRFRNLLVIINRYSRNLFIPYIVLFLSVFVNIFRYIMKGNYIQVKFILRGIADYYKKNFEEGLLSNLLKAKK